MAKFIIYWDIGYGLSSDVVDVESQEEADNAAYEAAKEEFDMGASYGAAPYTKELAEEHGIE